MTEDKWLRQMLVLLQNPLIAGATSKAVIKASETAMEDPCSLIEPIDESGNEASGPAAAASRATLDQAPEAVTAAEDLDPQKARDLLLEAVHALALEVTARKNRSGSDD